MEAAALLLRLLSAELKGEALPGEAATAGDGGAALFELARRHDLAHLLPQALHRQGLPVPPRLQQEAYRAVLRYERMEQANRQIEAVLEGLSIPFVPLKGSVLRAYYPEPWMRTSCDIDILIHEDALERAMEGLIAAGYRSQGRNYHDVSLFSPGNIHLELHFCIMEDIQTLDSVLKDAWEYALPVQGCRQEFIPAFFLFHLYAHASYHFLRGGCGLRTLMDLWVAEHRMGISLESARPLLERAGIWPFAQALHRLVGCCFDGAPADDLTDQMLSYILTGGVYGTPGNRAAVDRTHSRSTLLYALRRLFMPYRSMAVRYPVLQKWPVLLPVFWLVRLFEMITRGSTANSLEELQSFHGVTDAQAEKIAAMWRQLGL